MYCNTKSLSVVRGTTNTIRIDVTDANGTPYALGTGEVLRFGVKQDASSTGYLIRKDITSGTGSYLVTLMPEDTIGLAVSQYLFDVGLQSGDNYYNIIPATTFDIQANITKKEAG